MNQYVLGFICREVKFVATLQEKNKKRRGTKAYGKGPVHGTSRRETGEKVKLGLMVYTGVDTE